MLKKGTAAVLNLSDLNEYQTKKYLNPWSKPSKYFSSNDVLNVDGYAKQKEDEVKTFTNVTNSTLSLHISAYENFTGADSDENRDLKQKGKIEDSVKKWKTVKQFFTSPMSQNAFEFPRQQTDQNNQSELMQFKASQRLLNPNQPQGN
uniref:Uncharacterized protein n=1 Tax=Panagrolaimus sp. ES5 TaxID=591445 RepID=A0AC34FCX4_9BILA